MASGPADTTRRTADLGVVSHAHPWPGLESFREADAEFFHGRRAVCDELVALALAQRLVVLYGRSGFGKTSLLLAGAFPRWREALVLPVRIRLAFSDMDALPLKTQVRFAIEQAAAAARVEGPTLEPGATMWEWFHRAGAQFWNERNRRLLPLLVLDQFEEVFTLGRLAGRVEATQAFVDELVDLMRGSMPADVTRRCERDPDLALRYASGRDTCHVILSLRKDYLSELLRLGRRVPGLLDHRLELRGMSQASAEDVVKGPGAHLIAPGLERQIVARVVGAARSGEEQSGDSLVDPAILSVFCRELSLRRPEGTLITAELLQDSGTQIIEEFYERSVRDVDPRVRAFVEDELLTESGLRDSAAEEDALGRDGVDAAAIERLVDRRLLRRQAPDEGALVRLELTHDVLCAPVLASRSRRRAVEHEQAERRRAEQLERAAREAEARAHQERELRATREKVEALQEVAKLRARQTRLFALLAAVALLCLVAMALAAWQYRDAGTRTAALVAQTGVQQAVSLDRAGRADRAMAFLAHALRQDGGNATARGLVLDAVLHRDWPLPIATLRHARAVTSAQFDATGERVLTASEDGTVNVWDLRTARPLGAPLAHGERVRVLLARFLPADPEQVLTLADDGVARVWRWRDGTSRAFRHPGTSVTWATVNAADGRVATGAADGSLRVWNATGEPTTVQAHAQALNAAQFSPDGQWLATASEDGAARLWAAPDGTPRWRADARSPVQVVQFSPDSALLATGGRDGAVNLWDTATGALVAGPLANGGGVLALQFSGDGSRLVAASSASHTSATAAARVWDVRSGQPVGAPLQHGHDVVAASFSSDGSRVLTASADGAARIWDARTGQLLGEPMRHDEPLRSAQFSRDGARVVTASDDGSARVWDVRAGRALPAIHRVPPPVVAAHVRASGDRLAFVSGDGRLLVAEGRETEPRAIADLGDSVRWAAFDDDGTRLAAITWTGAAVVDVTTGLTTLLDLASPARASFSRDGRRVALMSNPGVDVGLETARGPVTRGTIVRVFDATTGEPAGPELTHERGVLAVAFDAAGEQLATASEDGGARIWRIDRGEPVGAALSHDAEITGVQFSPDGRWLATSSIDRTARLWPAGATGGGAVTLRHRAAVLGVQFSPDGRFLATLSEDATARLWAVPSGALLLTLLHDSPVEQAAFAPDGRRLATATRHGDIRVWDLATGLTVGSGLTHEAEVYTLQFVAGDQQLVSASGDGTVCWWDVPTGDPRDAPLLADLAEAFGGQRVAEGGVVLPLDDPVAALDALRRRLGQLAPPASREVRWALEPREARAIAPALRATVADFLGREFEATPQDGRRPPPPALPWHPSARLP